MAAERLPHPFRRRQLLKLYRRLYKNYGPQHWWPAKTPFEVMVGAVLTQNTAWINVERAIANLRRARCLSAGSILALAPAELAELIRPSGYFNIKERRLRSLCEWFRARGGLRRLRRMDTGALRDDLLAVHGIGPETADDILLYAFGRPVFVIDAYTRRLFARLGLARGDEHYESLRRGIEAVLEPDVVLFNEYHALIVRHAKESCTARRGCRHCRIEAPLQSFEKPGQFT
ncbi:MAG: endonuclease [Gammaproteobacteria bacterium]|nr:endonuclease [Gammaproteobacteria bacterium]